MSNAQDSLDELNKTAFSEVPRPMTPAELMQKAAEDNLKNMFDTACGYYGGKRLDNELDLVKEIRDRLFAAGVSGLDVIYDQNRHIQAAVGRKAHAQQYHLNRFFSDQLMLAQALKGVDTRQSRYCLIYEIQPEEWMKIIENQTIPSLISTGLYHA